MDYCYIFAKSFSHELAANVVKMNSKPPHKIVGTKKKWKKIVVGKGKDQISFIAKAYRRGGDTFSETMLSLHAFVKAKRRPPSIKKKILEAILDSQMGIGIAMRTQMGSNEDHLKLISLVCKATKGYLFTGQQIADHRFNVLI
jgi:hypothetical protein